LKNLSRKFTDRLAKGELPKLFNKYNRQNKTSYRIKKSIFPKNQPYGWKNYPYDYYNIWVKHAGNEPYMDEPTLEMLTRDYQVIIFKHCFPVSGIQPDSNMPDIDSELKTLANYKLQYTALRDKLHSFPDTKFILFTGATLTKSATNEEDAIRARSFFNWVKQEWDQPGDNIFIWDLYELETEVGLYLKEEYAESPVNSHPNTEFASRIVKLLFNRITDVIDNEGNTTSLKGEKI